MAISSVGSGDNMRQIESQQTEPQAKSPEIIENLPGRCAYFPHTDYHNLAILNEKYKTEKFLKDELVKRLLHYLLCFDTILIHSSDPLRSRIVYDILSKNDSLIINGAIKFVFSFSINDISRDYRKYIERKTEEYGKNPNSKLDIVSLTQPHMTDEYWLDVTKLLNKTPELLRRSESGSQIFGDLIEHDLSEIEHITMHKDYLDSSEINLLNLTLYQLLHLQINEKGPIFDSGDIDGFIKSWKNDISTPAPFSRHTITTELNNMANKGNNARKGISVQAKKRLVKAIEYRLSMLYSKISCSDHFLLELDPDKERRSLYSWLFIKLFLENISNRQISLNCQKVQKIRSDSEWRIFKEAFALSMCDLHMKSSFAQPKETELKDYMPTVETYNSIIGKHNLGERFSSLKSILLED
jgi:hypothetical protein